MSNLRDRLGAALYALSGRLFDDLGVDGLKAAEIMPTWEKLKPLYPEISFENLVKYGWRRNELIFACISKAANTAAQVELDVFVGSNTTPTELHPLKKLIQAPNPYMTEFDFWASITIYQKIFGRAYFEKQRNNAGQVIALWPLRPDWVHPVPKSGTELDYYEFAPPGVVVPARIEVGDMLDFKLWDPMGLFSTWSPSAVAARAGDVDNAATDFLKLFFEKGGTPPGLLKTVQKLQDSQVEILRARWRARYGGYANWLEPAILDVDATYQRIGLTFKEMGFETLDGRNEARICMVMDVPPIIVGAKVGLDRATYSNYNEARQAWWEDSLIPMYANYGDTIQNQLVPEFGQGVSAKWNWTKVPALQVERNARWERATKAFEAGGITLNMFLEEIGKIPIGPQGDVFLRNPALIAVPMSGEQNPALPAPTPAPATEPITEIASLHGHGNGNGNGNGHHHHQEKVPGLDASDRQERSEYEARLARKLEAYFRQQWDAITKEVQK